MPRRECNGKNELKMHDNLSNSEVTLLYRMPTTTERQGFLNKAISRIGTSVEFHQEEARWEFGLKILTGIVDGDFERLEEGKYVPISSREQSEYYYPTWKEWMGVYAADLVSLLGRHVFDAPSRIVEEGGDIAGK